MDNKISTLRKFFRLTNASFAYMNSITIILGGKVQINPMEILHKMALTELEKTNPDLEIIYNLINQMEKLTNNNE